MNLLVNGNKIFHFCDRHMSLESGFFIEEEEFDFLHRELIIVNQS